MFHRFESKISARTLIRYVTDGLLLRYLLADPLLSNYGIVMVDEAHERSLHSDVVLGLLKKIRRKRADLRVIITSATINATAMKDFFQSRNTSVCVFPVLGRSFPVDVLYLSQPAHNYIRALVTTVLSIHKEEGKGDILAFLPGAEEINTAAEELAEFYEGSDLSILPLYGALPAASQSQAFARAPSGVRKVILATNIAETSLTIDGVRFVVDTGFSRINYFNTRSGIDALITAPISQASAAQRAGRAGRTMPGKCFRLYTEEAFTKDLAAHTIPELQRADISWAVLELKALGVLDVLHFDYPSPPSADALCHALELLFSLGALDDQGGLTSLGGRMAEMPLEPRVSKCLLTSLELGCAEEMLTVAAMCDVEHPFITLRGRASEERKQRLNDSIGALASLDGDHITLLRVFGAAKEAGFTAQWCEEKMLSHRTLTRAKEVCE